MITETAGGTCPADLMADGLLAACQEQIVEMSAGLASLGEIETMTYVRTEETPEGPVELYAVTFSAGVTLNWGIGQFKDGKFQAAYASMADSGA